MQQPETRRSCLTTGGEKALLREDMHNILCKLNDTTKICTSGFPHISRTDQSETLNYSSNSRLLTSRNPKRTATHHHALRHRQLSQPPSLAMASRLAPLFFRSALRSTCRAARPQIRALSVTAVRPSDTLQVVSRSPSACPSTSSSYPSDRHVNCICDVDQTAALGGGRLRDICFAKGSMQHAKTQQC